MAIKFFFILSILTGTLLNEERVEKPAEKEKQMNEALEIYASNMNQFEPKFGNGKIYYNLANTFYQLGEYPYALLYYNKALLLRPYDQFVLKNMRLAEKQMGFRESTPTVTFPMPTLLQFFSLFSLLFFTFWSLWLWVPRKLYRNLAIAMCILSSFLLVGVIYKQYFSKIEGIVVTASPLYYEALQDKKGQHHVFSGSKVTILGEVKEGEWLKILTGEGNLGYVPSKSVRII